MARRGEKKYIQITDDNNDVYEGQIIQTIISEGDAIGAVIVLAKEGKNSLTETEQKAAIIAANFLGRQMEG